MHHNRRTLRSDVPRPHPSRRRGTPHPPRAPRGDASTLLPLRARRAALLGVLHRPHPEPEHPPSEAYADRGAFEAAGIRIKAIPHCAKDELEQAREHWERERGGR